MKARADAAEAMTVAEVLAEVARAEAAPAEAAPAEAALVEAALIEAVKAKAVGAETARAKATQVEAARAGEAAAGAMEVVVATQRSRHPHAGAVRPAETGAVVAATVLMELPLMAMAAEAATATSEERAEVLAEALGRRRPKAFGRSRWSSTDTAQKWTSHSTTRRHPQYLQDPSRNHPSIHRHCRSLRQHTHFCMNTRFGRVPLPRFQHYCCTAYLRPVTRR